MDSNHRANIVRITEIQPHPNADRLEKIILGGYQVCARKGEYHLGDLALYVQPDSIVPERPAFSFVWETDGGGKPREPFVGCVPEKYRRITVRKFRKEYSEGLLMPLDAVGLAGKGLSEGDDAAELVGITHYNPPEDEPEVHEPSIKQSKVWPRSWRGWMYFLWYWCSFTIYNPWGQLGGGNERAPKNTPPMYDVESYKNFTDALIDGEVVTVTEKIHGSNARYTYRNDIADVGWQAKLRALISFGRMVDGKMYAGSRKLWKSPTSSNTWRKILQQRPDIRRWCTDHPEYTLYGEAIPTQGGFDYGLKPGEVDCLLFDILDPLGVWVPLDQTRRMLEGYDIRWVPVLYEGPWDFQTVSKLVDGKTHVPGAKHVQEGIVTKANPDRFARGLGRVSLKIVSNAYYEIVK